MTIPPHGAVVRQVDTDIVAPMEASRVLDSGQARGIGPGLVVLIVRAVLRLPANRTPSEMLPLSSAIGASPGGIAAEVSNACLSFSPLARFWETA